MNNYKLIQRYIAVSLNGYRKRNKEQTVFL
jgi:hypothetical protein